MWDQITSEQRKQQQMLYSKKRSFGTAAVSNINFDAIFANAKVITYIHRQTHAKLHANLIVIFTISYFVKKLINLCDCAALTK